LIATPAITLVCRNLRRDIGKLMALRQFGVAAMRAGQCTSRAFAQHRLKQGDEMFVAVYWWRVHPGKEDQFREAWRRGTRQITQIYGSFGSRLHRDRDGRCVGYAEWPDEATWRAAFERKMVYPDKEARRMFVDAIAETPPDNRPVFTMTVTDDLLVRDGKDPRASGASAPVP
jgi:heme-degrading monooxygenase HmoA